MQQEIVPRGFEKSSHPIFSRFSPPAAFAQLRSCKNCEENSTIETFYSAESSSKSVLTQFPGVQKETAGADNNGQCAICLSTYEQPVTLVQCLHSFCLTCVQQWFLTLSRPRCPLCQTEHVGFLKYSSLSGAGPSSSLELWSAKPPERGFVDGRRSGRRKNWSASVTAAAKAHRARFKI
eukprot:gene35602-43178_t